MLLSVLDSFPIKPKATFSTLLFAFEVIGWFYHGASTKMPLMLSQHTFIQFIFVNYFFWWYCIIKNTCRCCGIFNFEFKYLMWRSCWDDFAKTFEQKGHETWASSTPPLLPVASGCSSTCKITLILTSCINGSKKIMSSLKVITVIMHLGVCELSEDLSKVIVD